MGQELVDAMESTVKATAEVCQGLTAEDWARPTGCPGWSVHDVLAHLVGLEVAITTGVEPDHELPSGLGHVKSPMAEYMERHVDARRTQVPRDTLAEFIDAFDDRVRNLRALADGAFDEPTPGPMGSEPPLSRMLAIRVFDLWAHEQDIRRAVGKPGGMDSKAAYVSLDQCKRFAGPAVIELMPAQSTLSWHLDGVLGGDVAWSFDNGKANALDTAPDDPTVAFSADTETFVALCCGRADARPEDVVIQGDVELGARVLAETGFTP